MANKRLITELVFKTNADGLSSITVDEEIVGGRVKAISFRKETHTTTGSAGCPCYVATFVNSTVQMVIPRESVKFVLTDENKHAVEDGAEVPDLPEE
jgi:acylphosphatase